MRVFIHSGHLSVDNGAIFPLTFITTLAKAIGIDVDWGHHYYDDSLDVPIDDLPTVLEMLNEGNMLYRVEWRDNQWQNVKTEAVAKRLGLSTQTQEKY